MEDERLPLYDEEGQIIHEDFIDEALVDEELQISPEVEEQVYNDNEDEVSYSVGSSFKILIDPGHFGGYNRGALNSYYEGTAMFHLGQYLVKYLNEYPGIKASITRKNLADNPSLDGRGRMAKGYDMFVSLHSDGFNSPNAVGVSVFYSVRRPQSKGLALMLGQRLTTLLNSSTGVTRLRGAKTRSYPSNPKIDYYGVIRSSVVHPSVKYSFLIEHGFHSNPKECAFLNNDANLQKIAKLEAEILASVFTKSKPESKPEPTPKPKPDAKPAPDNGGDTYAVINKKGIPGYNTAADAMAGKNKKSHVPYGTYRVYKRHSSGSINITNKAGSPGSWINPNDNKDSDLPKGNGKKENNLTAITLTKNNQPVVTAEQAVKLIRDKTKGNAQLSVSIEELVNNYINCGTIEHIRWDIALCQAIHETGWFKYGGVVKSTDNNYCGLGAGTGLVFPTAFDGVMSHIQHLKAYANSDALEYDMIDPRFKYVPVRGLSPYVEWLGQADNPHNKDGTGSKVGWAIPGKGYGAKILAVLEMMKKV